MRPDALARNFTTLPRTSTPSADFSITTHFENERGTVSPFGFMKGLPKSTVIAILFFPVIALVAPHICEKSGAILGVAASGTLSLLKVNAQPSTDPSGIFTVGPVIAMVHIVAPGAA